MTHLRFDFRLAAQWLVCCSLLAGFPAVRAEVKLPDVLRSGMVMQRDEPVALWGTADPAEAVQVKLGAATVKTVADAKGSWQVRLPAMAAGGPHELSVTGKNTVTLTDILFGEVWLCAGQSNMSFPLKPFDFYDGVREDMAKADFPLLRLYNPAEPGWKTCTPQAVGKFSATPFYFGRYLHQELKVPVGLVVCAQISTPIETWISPDEIKASVWGRKMIEDRDSQALADAKDEYRKKMDEWKPRKQAWDMAVAFGLEDPGPLPQKVVAPAIISESERSFGGCFESLVEPVIPLAIRGFIWYQGEANLRDCNYLDKMKTLVTSWRRRWNQDKMLPFYFVQIAPYSPFIDRTTLPRFWDVQAVAAREIPDSAVVCTIDIGDPPINIHPPNKRELGRRLGLVALARTYGRSDVVWSGPVFRGMKIEKNKARIRFDRVGGGLVSRDGKPLAWFQVSGDDKKFVEAKAEIEGDSVVVWSDGVQKPVAVRYAWHQTPGYTLGTIGPTGPVPNLVNKEGLPAFPFRTDVW